MSDGKYNPNRNGSLVVVLVMMAGVPFAVWVSEVLGNLLK